MTQESLEIALAVDQFPEHVRVLLRDATLRIVEVYAATTLKNYQRVKVASPPGYDFLDAPKEPLPANVITFPRRSSRESTRTANACPSVVD